MLSNHEQIENKKQNKTTQNKNKQTNKQTNKKQNSTETCGVGGGIYSNTSVVHMHDQRLSKHTLTEIYPFEEKHS